MTNTANRIKYADPVDPWEIITTPWGELPAWKADAIANGAMNVYAQVRNDAVEAQAKRTDIEERERVVSEREACCDQRERRLAATAARLGDEIDRVSAHQDKIEQARADQEREQEEPLPAPPDQPADPPPGADAALAGDPSDPDKPADDTHIPTGELHDLPPNDPEQQGRPEIEHDTRGEFLRLRHDEIEFPSGELPRPPAQQQPIAAGLDGGRE